MRTRFEIDVPRRPARPRTSVLERQYLSVLEPVIRVSARTDHFAVFRHDDRPDVWIGRRKTNAAPRQLQSLAKKNLVSVVIRHEREDRRLRVPHLCAHFAQRWDSTPATNVGFPPIPQSRKQ